jgi:hypothetical protein
MRCILHGHEYQTYDGHGAYKGARFRVCVHCGKTVALGSDDLAADIEATQVRIRDGFNADLGAIYEID